MRRVQYERAPLRVILRRLGIIALVVALLVAMVCSLTGCGAASSQPEETKSPGTPYIAYELDGGYFTIAEFRLTDGTRCVVVAGNTGRGITCEWKSGPNNVENDDAKN